MKNAKFIADEIFKCQKCRSLFIPGKKIEDDVKDKVLDFSIVRVFTCPLCHREMTRNRKADSESAHWPLLKEKEDEM